MTSGEHLSPGLIAGYRARTLSAEQLDVAARHFAVCAECRAAVRRPGDEDKLVQAFGVDERHLSFEELEKSVEGNGQLHPHLARCEMCAAEWRDLKTFRTSLEKPERKRLRVIIPAVVSIAAALAVVMLPKHSAVAPVATITTPVAAIEDGGRTISLDTNGALHGLEHADGALQSLAATAIRTGELPSAAGMSNLARTRETMLGSNTAADAAITPTGPVGTVVASLQPEFRWNAGPEARRFIVSVYSTDFRIAAQSAELASHDWECPVVLKAGATYLWTVSGLVGGKRVTAPHAPEPEARFRIADAAEAVEFRAALAIQPRSDLAVAVAAAKLGMRQEADAALQRLAERNPGSDLPARLAAGLHKQPK